MLKVSDGGWTLDGDRENAEVIYSADNAVDDQLRYVSTILLIWQCHTSLC